MSVKKKTNTEIREIAFIGGKAKAGRFTIPDTSAIHFSYLLRHDVMKSELDGIWKGSAFAFIHLAEDHELDEVIYDIDAFKRAVDKWTRKNKPTHDESTKFMQLLVAAYTGWVTSSSSRDETNEEPDSGN